MLAAVAVLSTAGVLLWGNEAEPGSRAFWMIARMRVESLGVIGIVALCHSFATVTFHTVTAVSYTHLTLPTTCTRCRSRWSPYH